MISSNEPIVVTGPARAETVSLLRSVAASVGARADMDVVAIEEFRIAVDEAASLLLVGGRASRLEMSLMPRTGSGFEVLVRTDGDGSMFDIDRATSWPWRVVRTLTRDAELSLDAERAQVAFVIGEGPEG